MHLSTKIVDGFSCCFRQWKAKNTHCSFLHGYSIYFHIIYQGDLDERNWVMDFGGMKRSKTKISWNLKEAFGGADWVEFTPDEWFRHMFDHTVVVSIDDPQLDYFRQGDLEGLLNLRVLPQVGCEKFAELVFSVINYWVLTETEGRVSLVSVECFEHNKNSAIYLPNKN